MDRVEQGSDRTVGLSRNWIVGALLGISLALSAGRVLAGDDAPPAPGIEDVKRSVLDRLVAEARRQREQDCPADGSTAVFAGSEVAGSGTLDFSLVIDGGAPLHQVFSGGEVDRPGHGELVLLGCLVLAEGSHLLQATVSGTAPGSLPDVPPLEVGIDAPGNGAPLVVVLDKPKPWSAPQLRLDRPAASGLHGGLWSALKSLFGGRRGEDADGRKHFLPGAPSDPQVRYAHFLGRTRGSLSQLIALEQPVQPEPAPALATLELARARLAFGLSAEAERGLRSLDARVRLTIEAENLDLDLAAYCYARGEFDRVADVLAFLQPGPGRLPSQRWKEIHARVLVAQRNYGEAVAALLAIPNLADYPSWVRYYDLGVSLFDSGHVAEGLTALNRIGNIVTDDPALRALRDRANLSVANHFLIAKQGASAIPLYGRINSTGSYADEALLGLGWAWLAPAGEKQAEAALGDEIVTGLPPEAAAIPGDRQGDQNLYRRFDVDFFDRETVPESEDARLKRALVAWTALLDGDAADPQVAEAELATSWGLRKLGARGEAVAHDERAVTLAEADLRRIEASQARVDQPGWFEHLLGDQVAVEPSAQWQTRALPETAVSLFLEDVLARDDFQAGMRDYRDLIFLKDTWDRLATQSPGSLQSGSDPALRQSLETLKAAEEATLQQALEAPLEAQGQLIRRILVQARTTLTQEYDRPKSQ